MSNFKTKAKNFWENHKTDVIAVGAAAVAAIGVGVYTIHCYNSGYKYGAAAGFNAAFDWIDEHFPEQIKAKELWENYIKENPDKICTITPSGKVIE